MIEQEVESIDENVMAVNKKISAFYLSKKDSCNIEGGQHVESG